MTTLTVRLSTIADAKARIVEAGRCALAGDTVEAVPSVNFTSYDDMHRVLAPSRLAIVKALAGQEALSIREVARRVPATCSTEPLLGSTRFYGSIFLGRPRPRAPSARACR